MHAEEIIEKSERQWHAVFDNSAVGIGLADVTGKFIAVNSTYKAMFGYNDEELRQLTFLDITHEEDREISQALVEELLNGKRQHFHIEKRYRRKDGSVIWVHHYTSYMPGGGNTPPCLLAVGADISERKRAEEALRRSEERWRSVFENSAVGIALTDTEGRFQAANAAYQTMLGYSEQELKGMSFLDITHEDDRESNRVLVDELLEGRGEQFQIEKRYLCKDGKLIWVRNNVSLVPGSGSMPRFLLAIVEDITERKRFEEELHRERDRLRLLLDINNTIVSNLELKELFKAISSSLRRITRCDYANLKLLDEDTGELRLHVIDHPTGQGYLREGMNVPLKGSASGLAFRTGKPVVLDYTAQARQDPEIYGNPEGERFYKSVAAEAIRSAANLPLLLRGRVLGVLTLASRDVCTFAQEDIDFLSQVASQIAIAVDNALNYHQVNESRAKLQERNVYLEEEFRTEHNFEEIIGESLALRKALSQVETVAPTDSTVLIFGETGTGKELIARALHNLSSRSEHAFVRLNCAAIPLGLLESELFGHERGAFTGAISQKVGRFELANHGTLFLDEVGDIPLELQPKLLRVLQEQEFERLGSTRTIRVNVRLIAATHRDLESMVEEDKFRSDLYYRLKIFPITLPPLRERAEDIPSLVRHFANIYSRRMSKPIEDIPQNVMKSLLAYHWPGNVRELQNFIERAVILTKGKILNPPLAELKSLPTKIQANAPTLKEAERQQILKALEECAWVLGGPKGAAARLGLKRTTLFHKMRRLGITRPES